MVACLPARLQVKRTDELARKLRFFTDQVEKAALITGSRTSVTESLDLDQMEARPSTLAFKGLPAGFTTAGVTRVNVLKSPGQPRSQAAASRTQSGHQ